MRSTKFSRALHSARCQALSSPSKDLIPMVFSQHIILAPIVRIPSLLHLFVHNPFINAKKRTGVRGLSFGFGVSSTNRIVVQPRCHSSFETFSSFRKSPSRCSIAATAAIVQRLYFPKNSFRRPCTSPQPSPRSHREADTYWTLHHSQTWLQYFLFGMLVGRANLVSPFCSLQHANL